MVRRTRHTRKVAPAVLRAARSVARTLAGRGALAVVMMGSHVRGDATGESDVDLIVVGRGPWYRLERHHGHLVSISWRTLRQLRQVFDEPGEAAGAILGWRQAVVLHDPQGLARSLREEARRWTWARVDRKCDAWVADQITGYAEDVQRIIGALRRRRPLVVAAYRLVLAVRLTEVLAVHRRTLYDGEADGFTKVGAVMGARWRRAQALALGVTRGAFAPSCRAACELYGIAAAETRHLLDDRQRVVVTHACRIAGFPLPAGPHP